MSTRPKVYNNRVTHDQHRHNAHGGRSTHDDKMAAVQMDGNNADDADAPQDKDTDKDKGALAKDATQNDDNNTGGSALAQHETRVGAAAFDPPEHLPIEDDDKDDQDEDNTATDTDVLAKIALNVDAAGGGTDMSDKDVYNNRVTHDQHRHNAHGGRSTHDDKMAAVQMDGNNADDADAPQDKDTDKDKGALAKDATQNDDNNTGGSALAQHETRVGAAAFDPPEHLPIEGMPVF
ncbi:hypothetical protein RI367_008431 [Sorochytrium milnesiophthora]